MTGGGALDIATVTGAISPLGGVLATAGDGFDVATVDGARIAKPLTVTFEAPAPRAGLTPVVAHRADDGTWEYLPVSWDGHVAVLKTQRFSPNVLSWIGADTAWAWLKPRLLSALAGRTPAPPCAGHAHAWASVTTTADLVHECLTDNDDARGERVELSLTSNRDAWVHVRLPDAVDYAWVEYQPDVVRRYAAGMFGMDSAKDVLLPPGGRMTIGFRRSAQRQSYTVTALVDEATVFMSALTAIPGAFVSISQLRSSYTALLPMLRKCGLGVITTNGGSSLVDPEDFARMFGCLAGGALQNLSNPVTAMAAARDIYCPVIDAGTLEEQGRLLSTLGQRLVALGFVAKAVTIVVPAIRGLLLAGWGNLSDAVQQEVLGSGATDMTVTTAAKPVAPAPPPGPASPPALAPQPAPAPAPPPVPNPAPIDRTAVQSYNQMRGGAPY